jgi:hypothetical protein
VGDKIGEDTMGWACVLYRGEKYTRFWQETWWKDTNWKWDPRSTGMLHETNW